MQVTPHSPRLRRLEKRLTEIASSRRLWPWAIAVLAIVLSLPTLTIGWLADDYAERWVAMHDQAMGFPGTIAGMKSYVTGEPETHRYLAEHGVLPLWSDPDMKLCFWRPLSEVTEWSDYQVWPHNPVA